MKSLDEEDREQRKRERRNAYLEERMRRGKYTPRDRQARKESMDWAVSEQQYPRESWL